MEEEQTEEEETEGTTPSLVSFFRILWKQNKNTQKKNNESLDYFFFC